MTSRPNSTSTTPTTRTTPTTPATPAARQWQGMLTPLALAAMLALPLAAAAQNFRNEPPVLTAQQVRSTADLRIRGFDVKPVERIGAGSELDFTVWGNPGAQASVRIDGARRLLTLQETAAGYYSGTYVVASSDRVEPGARAVAQLRAKNFVTTATLEEPLQAGYAAANAAASAPDITKVSSRLSATGAAGKKQQVNFTVNGTPGGNATVTVPGGRPRLVYLQETRRGEYTGAYVPRAGDRLDNDQPVVARLRVDDRVATSNLPHAFDGMQFTSDRKQPACLDCGTVASVQRIEVAGDEGYVGTVAGGVLGALLGSQVGGGDGRKVAGALGAVGGALLGHEVDKRRSKREQFEVVVRMNDGASRTFLYADEPGFRTGQRVRTVGEGLQAM